MDFIPFEKVSLQEAKAVLDRDSAPSRPERNWSHARDGGTAKSMDLTEQAWEWLDALPKEIQPGGLVQRFPRIANKLAEQWRRPANCEKYLDALILDHRGSRKGFPPDIAGEIALLKTHLNRNTVVQPSDIWGERKGN
ncbi:MAG: hypothetical protein A3I66_03530 [Burkholderiales bacterium RIFCSPLOWO2_02_FULL_57_36]|nr:MAG: hypothetical protein A3I66_03530 [Burkholderiales bacterium RIFCSPLOWO2_02_FULL_57_36]